MSRGCQYKCYLRQTDSESWHCSAWWCEESLQSSVSLSHCQHLSPCDSLPGKYMRWEVGAHLVRIRVPRVKSRPAMMTSLVTRFMSDGRLYSVALYSPFLHWPQLSLTDWLTDWVTGKVSTCGESRQRESERVRVWCGVVWSGVVPSNMNDDDPTYHHSTLLALALPLNLQSSH